MARVAKPVRIPPAPDESDLHEAALRHLARYSCSVASLTRVLDRRIGRWARANDSPTELVEQARARARAVAARLVQSGVLDDAAYAATRARSLGRSGRSRRAIAAHLAGRGVDRTVLNAALPDAASADGAEHDLTAAVRTMRRKRIGPFRAAESADADVRRRELGMLARGGFAGGLARRALALSAAEAEEILHAAREE